MNPRPPRRGFFFADTPDHSLGIRTLLNTVLNTLLNGAPVSTTSLDTSAPTMDIIDYVAMDTAGNTASFGTKVDPRCPLNRRFRVHGRHGWTCGSTRPGRR